MSKDEINWNITCQNTTKLKFIIPINSNPKTKTNFLYDLFNKNIKKRSFWYIFNRELHQKSK